MSKRLQKETGSNRVYVYTESVDSARADGGGKVDIRLSCPVTAYTCEVDAISLCRMCVRRMPLPPVEKLVMEMALDMEAGIEDRRTSYEAVAVMLGRCEHSVKNAAASLRRSGLLMTARAARAGSTVAFSCGALIAWADGLIREAEDAGLAGVDSSGDSVAVIASAQTYTQLPRPRLSREEKPKQQRTAAKKERVLLSKNPPVPVPSTVREEPKGGSNAGIADELMMSAPYDGEFDSTVERADTLRAAGRNEFVEDDGDDDEISFGSETAETDMGQGVRMNPNI